MNEPAEGTPTRETDSRFPTGPWTGFFLQPSTGTNRTWMKLQLSFSEDKLAGDGTDCIGEFTLKGRYETDSGKVWIHKTYIERHDVIYTGFAEVADKGIWGTWEIRQDFRGGWHIWPKGVPDPTGSTLKAEADVPIQREAATVLVEDD